MVSFRWVLMIKLVIASDLKYVPRKLATHKIFKRKKEKKESRLSSVGFEKVKFFYKKILPDSFIEKEA